MSQLGHLVFSRRENESFRIMEEGSDDPIFVTIEEVRGGKVKLSVLANKRYHVIRTELLLQDIEEKKHKKR